MKSLATLVAGLSLTLSLTLSIAGGSVMAEPEEGAKGLFFQQLDHPSDSLNTGIQYWIELHHEGKTIHATNKTAFHTGDKIRFHVRPNIDGFAYIMLKSGSRGEQAVLFPEKDRNEDNKITRGKEIVLPNDGMLGFDENPGVEKLTLLVSRKPIDTDAYMSGQEGPPRMVAMSSSGSKDLIPTQVYVAYLPPAATGVPESVKKAAASSKANTQKTTTTVTSVSTAETKKTTKPTKVATTKTSTHTKGANAINGHHDKDFSHVVTVATVPEETTSVVHRETDSPLKAGLVTVVFKDPNGVLAADISLEHLKE